MSTALAHVEVNGQDRPVEFDPAAARFTVREGNETAVLTFRLRGRTLVLLHTEVPTALRRQKVAVALARTALEYARDHGLKVEPICPFVAGYLERHPEYQDLLVRRT
jgi:uncharacterized protein